MLMRVRGRVAALAAACAGVCVGSAHAAPPQGFQSDSAFAGSYAARAVTSVPATTQRVSCYTPQVLYAGSLSPSQGYPDGGSTPCAGAATTGELIGPFGTQNVANPPLRVKDFSESDLHVDPTNPQHLIAVSKWFVNSEGYNHLAGFYESYDGGATWPQQGHVPGYEGWTDNSDPVGAFDPWGNFYAVLLPYMFRYLVTGEHFFLAPDVNPALSRSGMAVAVRPRGAATPAAWNVLHNGAPDLIRRTPFNGAQVFDKQWIAIDRNPRSRHFGRVYISWAIGTSDAGLRIYVSYSDARRNGTHTNWSAPKRVMQQRRGVGDNGSLPRVTPDGRVWLATSSTVSFGAPFTMSFTSSRDGGRTWAKRRVIVRHNVDGYKNTTFRSAFGEAFEVGTRKVGRFYPLYAVYENSTSNGPTGALRPRLVRRRRALARTAAGERQPGRRRGAAAEHRRRAERTRCGGVLRSPAPVPGTRHAGSDGRGAPVRSAGAVRAGELLHQHGNPVLHAGAQAARSQHPAFTAHLGSPALLPAPGVHLHERHVSRRLLRRRLARRLHLHDVGRDVQRRRGEPRLPPAAAGLEAPDPVAGSA
jgi:hypothetical protein